MAIDDLRVQSQVTNGGSADASDGPSVLVVDDDAGLLRLLKAILRSASYRVTTAQNGREALDVILQQPVDVIVMDLQMPVLNGPGFFRQLRARGDNTPVLVASSYGAREAQRELGAEGAIEKPFDPDDLLEAVSSLLIRSR